MLGKIQAIQLSVLLLVSVVGCSPLPQSGAGMLGLRPNVDVTNIQAFSNRENWIALSIYRAMWCGKYP